MKANKLKIYDQLKVLELIEQLEFNVIKNDKLKQISLIKEIMKKLDIK